MGFFKRKSIKNSTESATNENTTTISLNPTIDELRKFFRNDLIADIGGERLTSTTYYACMLIRCNAVAKLPLKLMRDKGQGAEKAWNHPLYKLLKTRPNNNTSAHDFMWATEFQRLEYGNAYWVIGTNRKGIINGLYLLDSTLVQIVVDKQKLRTYDANAVGYIYHDPIQGDIPYSADSIMHFKNFSKDGIHGTGIKQYLYQNIENEQYSDNVLSNKYKSGLQDPLIVQYTGALSDAKSNKIKVKFEEIGGTKNAGKVVPIPSEFRVEQLETKLVNSQFFQLQGLTTRKIANAFGVKGFQLNDMEKSTYNNIEQQNKAFYCDTLQNVLTAYEQEVDYKGLTAEQTLQGYYSKFNVESILRSDIATRYEAYVKAVNNAIMSPAEVRAKEDLPYKENTDKLIVGNGAAIFLDDLGKQYESN